jgi:hypothetical protein
MWFLVWWCGVFDFLSERLFEKSVMVFQVFLALPDPCEELGRGKNIWQVVVMNFMISVE